MVFRFKSPKKHRPNSPAAAAGRTKNVTTSDSDYNNSKDNAHHHHQVLTSAKSFETKLLNQGQKLFKKVIRHSTGKSTTSKSNSPSPATPAVDHYNHNGALRTPATALMMRHDGDYENPDTIVVKINPYYSSDNGAVQYPYDDDDAVVERIRQQLFYEEQGVEVTAQFEPEQTHEPPAVPRTVVAGGSSSSSPWLARSRKEEEKKQDDTTSRTTNVDSAAATPDSKNSRETSSLPPTPDLDASEANPIQRFPAVAAAVAAKQEASESKHNNNDDVTRNASTSLLSLSTASQSQMSSNASSIITRDQSSLFPNARQRSDALSACSNMTTPHSYYNNEKRDGRNNNSHNLPTSKNARTVTPPSPSPDQPFDEGPTTCTIREIANALPESEDNMRMVDTVVDNLQCTSNNACDPLLQKQQQTTTNNNHENKITINNHNSAAAAANDTDVTRKLLDVFNCGDDFTEFSGSVAQHCRLVEASPSFASSSSQQQQLRSCRLVDAFYDNSCGTYREAAAINRPYYDEIFAQRFLKDITEEGVNILWHLPPSDDDVDVVNWSGRSVVMKIKPGSPHHNNAGNNQHSNNDSNIEQPKLVWTTLGGGKDSAVKAVRCSVQLLAIQSISTFRDTISAGDDMITYTKEQEETTDTSCGVNVGRLEEEDEDVCLFAITTEEGDVQVFEASTQRERDLLVVGLKNVIARLSFHLIVGDAGASKELYDEEPKKGSLEEGELPPVSSPVASMNRIAHALMD